MRDVERISRILNELESKWIQYPDWRFHQLIENIFGCGRRDGVCHFHMEDDETERRIREAFE